MTTYSELTHAGSWHVSAFLVPPSIFNDTAVQSKKMSRGGSRLMADTQTRGKASSVETGRRDGAVNDLAKWTPEETLPAQLSWSGVRHTDMW